MCDVQSSLSVQSVLCSGVRQLKGLQLNHFAISCVRTSESGVILSLTTMMMHGIYKDNLRSQVVNESRFFRQSIQRSMSRSHLPFDNMWDSTESGC